MIELPQSLRKTTKRSRTGEKSPVMETDIDGCRVQTLVRTIPHQRSTWNPSAATAKLSFQTKQEAQTHCNFFRQSGTEMSA